MRAIHSVLKSGAPHCFYVITNKDKLTDQERARLAKRDGNEHVESPARYDILMEQAGFADVELTDVTPEFLQTLTDWKRAWEADADAFVELVGEEEYLRRLGNRSLDISSTADGLLKRHRVFGVKP